VFKNQEGEHFPISISSRPTSLGPTSKALTYWLSRYCLTNSIENIANAPAITT